MPDKITQLVDVNGDRQFPRTTTNAVYMPDGTTLKEAIDNGTLGGGGSDVVTIDDTVGETAAAPLDADTLGGHGPEYFASVEQVNTNLNSNEVLISTLTPSKTSDIVPNLSTLKETYKKVRIEIWYEQKNVLASTTAFLSDDLTGSIDCIFYDGIRSNEIRARYIDTTFKLMDVGSDQTNYCGAKMYGIKL